MRAYPARVINLEHGGVIVRFPDVPEAVACGESEQEVLDNARGVLEAVLECYLSEGRDLPEPSQIDGAPTVETELFDVGRWRPIFFVGRV